MGPLARWSFILYLDSSRSRRPMEREFEMGQLVVACIMRSFASNQRSQVLSGPFILAMSKGNREQVPRTILLSSMRFQLLSRNTHWYIVPINGFQKVESLSRSVDGLTIPVLSYP
jgi:hypothetical protein